MTPVGLFGSRQNVTSDYKINIYIYVLLDVTLTNIINQYRALDPDIIWHLFSNMQEIMIKEM